MSAPVLPEELVLSRLPSSGQGFTDSQVVALKAFFLYLRDAEASVSRFSPLELHEGQWAMLGIISRAYQLTLSSVEQLSAQNMNGFYAAARALMETLCSVVWANDNIDRLPSLVQAGSVRVGRILNSGYVKYPDVRDMYRDLSAIVHPNRDSHLLGPRPASEWQAHGVWTAFGLSFSPDFAAEMMGILGRVCSMITEQMTTLVGKGPEAVKKGKLMAYVAQRK